MSLMLVAGILFAPLVSVSASQTIDTNKVLGQQLTAIASYLERTFNLRSTTPLAHSELRQIVSTGSDWLVNAQEKSGHFAYEYVPYEDVYSDDDNIVRQAGALYELGEVARRDPSDSLKTGGAIENAIDYFEGISPEGEREDVAFRCITDGGNSQTCKLGATSLALAGMLGYLEQSPEKSDEYHDLIESYVAYILAMKKPEEGFRNKYRLDTDLETKKESSFSNGEALLALVRYYQYNEREDVKAVIDDTYNYLEGNEFDTALYLWIMAALKDMHTLWPSEAYTLYGKSFTDWRLAKLARVHHTKKNYCASTEGIVSAYSLLEASLDAEAVLRLRAEIDFWNTKNSVLQISELDRYRVASVDGVLSMEQLVEPEQAFGGFLTSDSVLTQRIDFTQHCISSYLQTLVDIEGQELE